MAGFSWAPWGLAVGSPEVDGNEERGGERNEQAPVLDVLNKIVHRSNVGPPCHLRARERGVHVVFVPLDETRMVDGRGHTIAQPYGRL